MYTETAMTADFYPASKRAPAHVMIHAVDDGRRRFITAIPVADKREARTVAAGMSATPWNF